MSISARPVAASRRRADHMGVNHRPVLRESDVAGQGQYLDLFVDGAVAILGHLDVEIRQGGLLEGANTGGGRTRDGLPFSEASYPGDHLIARVKTST